MNARLQGFLSFLELLAEGERRRAELIGGRFLEPALQPVSTAPRAIKFPLTGHQKPRLFADAPKSTVAFKH